MRDLPPAASPQEVSLPCCYVGRVLRRTNRTSKPPNPFLRPPLPTSAHLTSPTERSDFSLPPPGLALEVRVAVELVAEAAGVCGLEGGGFGGHRGAAVQLQHERLHALAGADDEAGRPY